MSFEIPIADVDGVVVAHGLWDGELYVGSARIAAVTGHERTADQLQSMILERDDLKELRFRSEGDAFTVTGWRGYEGFVGALRLVVPAMALHVGHIAGNMPALGASRREEIDFNYAEGGIE